MVRVFVYGTLLQGEANYGVAAPYIVSVEPGAVRGRLYDAVDYPALVVEPDHDDDGIVYGEWLTVHERGLAAMDELEQYYGPGDARNDYERVLIGDIDGIRSGWVYVWKNSRGCAPIRSGSWRSRSSSDADAD